MKSRCWIHVFEIPKKHTQCVLSLYCPGQRNQQILLEGQEGVHVEGANAEHHDFLTSFLNEHNNFSSTEYTNLVFF